MKRIARVLLVAFLIVGLTSFIEIEPSIFTGKISYRYSFSDLSGNDITERVSPLFGKGQYYFIDNNNYKTYDESNALTQLYNGSSNLYYYIKDSAAIKIDAAQSSSEKVIITKLSKTEKIAGYECNAVLIETENASTIYYYSSGIKTSPQNFAKHNFSEWNKYLETTDGALPLKYIMTDLKNKYIWTSTAYAVVQMNISSDEFVLPKGMRLKN